MYILLCGSCYYFWQRLEYNSIAPTHTKFTSSTRNQHLVATVSEVREKNSHMKNFDLIEMGKQKQ